MNAIVYSADTASNPFVAQTQPVAAGTGASSNVAAPNTFKNVESIALNSRDANSDFHPNIVKAVYQGNTAGEHKGDVRYLVHAKSSSKAYAFKTEAEARAFVSFASATARDGRGATLGVSGKADAQNLNLGSWDLLSAAGEGGNIRSAYGKYAYDISPSVAINGDTKTVYEMESGVMDTIAQYDYSQFAGTGLPSLPVEATYYLQNTFQTIPQDPGEFGVQLSALSSSATAVYEHNGYSKVENPPTITTEANVEKLVQTVFGPNTKTNAGHLNTLRLLGLASAGKGGGDQYANWKLSDQGTQILGRINQQQAPVKYLPSLAFAALESSKEFVIGSKLDLFVKADAAGTHSFGAKADASGNYAFADVQKHLQAQYKLLNPDFGDVPPRPLPEGLLERAPEVKTLLETVFGTSNIDESYVNVAIASGLVTYTDTATDTGNPSITTVLSTTPKGVWLQQNSGVVAA